jgi:Fe-S-cluster containining protein
MRRLRLPVVWDGGQALLGTRPYAGPGGDTVCAAFEGDVGGYCGCGIYARRPEACRRFEVAGFLCRQARRDAGLPGCPDEDAP